MTIQRAINEVFENYSDIELPGEWELSDKQMRKIIAHAIIKILEELPKTTVVDVMDVVKKEYIEISTISLTIELFRKKTNE